MTLSYLITTKDNFLLTFVKIKTMNFFSNLFAKQEDEYSDFNWIPLLEENQLNEILTDSKNKTIAIFKHSTRCGISRNAIKQFEKQTENNTIDFYFLDLLSFRNISNAIALKFGVEHQSPQLIVLKNKKVVAHASHHAILDIDLTQFK